MKIIHTSDWHLGHRLYNYDRSDEEAHFLRQLMEVVEAEQPDALVVCGDIFHTGAPGNDVAKSFTDGLLAVQAKCPTMETVVIAGNHDSYSRLVVDKSLWSRCRVHVFGMPAEDAEGRADFAKSVVRIGDKGIVAAVPFCHARNFPSVGDGVSDARARNYFGSLANFVRGLASDRPAVLVAHLAVRGELDFRGHDESLVVGGEECVGEEELGGTYDYIALGHIHCPQWVGGRRRARYCGTPRAIHFDETCAHGVDVVEVGVGAEPVVRTVVLAPLHALKTFGGDDGLPFDEALRALSESGLAADTYVRLNVRLGADELPGPDWTEKARQTCLSKGARFCVVNPVRTATAERKDAPRAVLSVTELRELSNDKVLEILSARHGLTERHRELLRALMEEVDA